MWTAARALVIVAALAVFFIIPLYSQSSDGTTALVPIGVLIDAVALIALVASAWSLWRDRRRA